MKRSKERGSVTLYVLIAMLFFIIILIGSYVYNANKQKVSLQAQDKTENIQEQDLYQQTYEESYGQDYVKKPMLLHYDGINNMGNRHDGAATKWKDLSGNNRDGIINGAVWEDNGLVFDGVNDWVNCTKIDFTKTITMEAVVSIDPDAIGKSMEFMGNWESGGGGLNIQPEKDFSSSLYIGNDWTLVRTGETEQGGQIHTVTLTYDGNTIKLYVDGSLKTIKNITGDVKLPNNNTVMALGCNPVGNNSQSNFFKGKIYAARMYEGALTEKEVAHNSQLDKMKYRNQGYSKRGEVFQYSGINNTGKGISNVSTWTNLVANNHHGTINGPVWKDNGIVLDGVDDWVNCGKVDFTKNVTMEVTVSFDSTFDRSYYVMGNWESGGGGMMIKNKVISGEFYINGKYNTMSSGVTVQPNQIYTIALTYDGTTQRLYVNGQEKANYKIEGTVGIPTNNTVIGLGSNPGGTAGGINYTRGKIYAARMYTRTLLSEEIKQNYEVDKQYYHMIYPKKQAYDATWQKVFSHNNSNGTIYFANEAEALNSDTANKFSILTYLEQYRKEDGTFEFLLEYPGISGYNRWKQSSNPCTTVESVTGYEPIHIDWTTKLWGGLCKSNPTTNTFLDGSVNDTTWYYAIGTYKAWNNAMPGPGAAAQEVNLWVRIK